MSDVEHLQVVFVLFCFVLLLVSLNKDQKTVHVLHSVNSDFNL